MQTTQQQAIACAHLEALLNPAKRMLIANTLIGNQRAVTWAQASIKTLRSLHDGSAAAAATHYASKGGYYVPAGWQAAWSALPIDVENYTLAQVQEFLAGQGVQAATDFISHSDINGVLQLKNSKITPADLHNKHSAIAADLDHNTTHNAPHISCKATIVGHHTPGPWQATDWTFHAATTVLVGDTDNDGDNVLVIAECAGHGRPADHCLADARLIAAAPQLLEALQAMLRRFGNATGKQTPAEAQALAAIAKATQARAGVAV